MPQGALRTGGPLRQDGGVGRGRRYGLLAIAIAAVVLAAGCDDGSARRAADVTISVAYDGRHHATVTVHDVHPFSAAAATRIIGTTASQVLATRERPALVHTGPGTYRATFAAVPLHGTVRVDVRPVFAATRSVHALPNDGSEWIGICIPRSRARWTAPTDGADLGAFGCNDWYGDTPPAPADLRLGHYPDGTLVPSLLLVLLAAGAVAAFPLYRGFGHGTLIALLCIPALIVSLGDALAFQVAAAGPFFSVADDMTRFGMDPDASLHHLEHVGALSALVVGIGFVVVAIAIAVTSYRRHARRRVEVTLRPV